MRVRAFMTDLDILSMKEAVEQIVDWSLLQDASRYVVTPNVDHTLTLRSSAEFRNAYEGAALRLIDGWPVAKAVELIFGIDVQPVPGSDLVPAIFDELQSRHLASRIYLLGALPGIAEIAADRIRSQWPDLIIAGTCSPPMGFERDAAECSKVCAQLRKARPDILILGLGAPKQELWIHRHRNQIGPCVAICAGATIDFLGGAKVRAPRWVRRLHLEWFHRVVQEPRRLFARYAKGMILFPVLSISEKLRHEAE